MYTVHLTANTRVETAALNRIEQTYFASNCLCIIDFLLSVSAPIGILSRSSSAPLANISVDPSTSTWRSRFRTGTSKVLFQLEINCRMAKFYRMVQGKTLTITKKTVEHFRIRVQHQFTPICFSSQYKYLNLSDVYPKRN